MGGSDNKIIIMSIEVNVRETGGGFTAAYRDSTAVTMRQVSKSSLQSDQS